MSPQTFTSRKHDIEGLRHLKPFLWGGFSPKPGRGYDELTCKNLVCGFVNRIAGMSGAHLFPFFVVFPDNTKPWLPSLHAHFVILSDRHIDSQKYRAARQRTHGIIMVKRYNPALGGIPYMYQNHEEMAFDDIFCRNGCRCRKKRIHREFLGDLHNMRSRWTV